MGSILSSLKSYSVCLFLNLSCGLTNIGVASNVLAAIGELGEVGGEDMRAYVEDLLPLIIDTLQDQSSVAKREVFQRWTVIIAEKKE